ncbi:hypothetical protein C8Q80DRAFT_1274334 [Daedaleopsis nitida]|nr:hypothetical protein C8Q80DRAFT_1274334 [Daedaleopsis nitida]
MQFSLAALVLAAAAFAHAQSTTSTAAGSIPTNISACIVTCITEAATANGCTGLTDVTCFCTNTQFQSQTLACLQKSCTADDLTTVAALQKAQCGSASGNSTTTSGASGSTATTPSSTDSTGAAAPTGSNAASALTAGVFGMGMVVVGAVFAL